MTKVRQREAANRPVEQATLSVNERILKECHQLYTDPENGLVSRRRRNRITKICLATL